MSMFLTAFERFPDNTAVIYEGMKYSYRDIDLRARRLAAAMQASGIEKRDLVAFQFGNGPDFIIALLATQLAGAIGVPIRKSETDSMLIAWCNHLRVKCLLVEPYRVDDFALTELDSCRSILSLETGTDQEYRPVSDDGDGAIIVHTAGTTARPKGVIQRTRTIERHTQYVLQHLHYREDDIVCSMGDLSHGRTMHAAMLPVFAVGGTLLILPTTSPPYEPDTVLDATVRYGATVLLGAPCYLAKVLHTAKQRTTLPKLRLAISISDYLPSNLQSAWPEVFGVPLIEHYGSTETCGMATTGGIGTLGQPFAGTQWRISDGELWIKGDILCSYWNEQDTKDAFVDGWFKTGDLAVRDEQNCYRIVGRSKHIIKFMGSPIAPEVIEAALMNHGSVADCMVAGTQGGEWGEDIEAFIVTNGTFSESDLREYADKALGINYRPARYWRVPALPRNSIGKLDRNAVATLRREVLQRERAL
jgi:acyl-CoA synthetase (AMP-forming)/AMP-acid ligase II